MNGRDFYEEADRRYEDKVNDELEAKTPREWADKMKEQMLHAADNVARARETLAKTTTEDGKRRAAIRLGALRGASDAAYDIWIKAEREAGPGPGLNPITTKVDRIEGGRS